LYICYSIKNGIYDYEEISYHLNEWGINISNTVDVNCINEGKSYQNENVIKGDKYVIILLSQELITDITVLSELENIKKLFLKNDIKVFCFVKEIVVANLPKRLEWLKNTIMLNTDTVIETHKAVYRVLLEYTSDKARDICGSEGKNVWDVIENSGYQDDLYIKNIKKAYNQIKQYDYERKITLLYALYTYITSGKPIQQEEINSVYSKCIENIYSYMGMCMPYDKTQLDIIKYCMYLMMKTESSYNKNNCYK
jgi:hypothetical protein